MAIAIGEQIGDYEVISSLGAGGIGEVYKVRHLISHRVEALKVLRPQQLGTTEPMERFMREIRVLASLNHPNIAALHTAFRRDDNLVMVMEFVEGETLGSRLRSTGINVAQSIGYVRQVLSALIYAHEQGVIHRDIKPANVMVDGNDGVKLLDFGLAVTGHDPSLTVAGWILGSLHYMSPEQVNGKKVDGRSDLYSLGATMYELLTGKVPIDGETGYAIMAGHLHHQPTAPATLNPNIPDDLSRVVLRALAKNPEERFQSAREFLQTMDAASLDKTEALRLTKVFHIGSGDQIGSGSGSGSDTSASTEVTPSSSSRATVPLPRPQIPRPQTQSTAPMTGTQTPGTQISSSPISGTPVTGRVAPDSTPSRSQPAPTPTQSKELEKSPSVHTPAVLEKISKELAVYIGPIAKIVVQKASGQHNTVQDLYNALSQEIESGKDREKFLATRRTIKA